MTVAEVSAKLSTPIPATYTSVESYVKVCKVNLKIAQSGKMFNKSSEAKRAGWVVQYTTALNELAALGY